MRTSVRVLLVAWVLLRRVAMVLVVVAIALRVGDVVAPRAAGQPELDVVVAIDRTTSMSAGDDPAGSRLAAVRRDVTELAGALPGARVSVVAFGASAQTELPFSTDRVALEARLGAITPEQPVGGNGSSLARPVPLLGALIDGLRGAAAASATGSSPDRRVVLVVASDGENTSTDPADPTTPWSSLEPVVDAAVVLGYGTTAGGLMPAPDSPTGHVLDPATGRDALSRLDPDTLSAIAEQLGGDYVARRSAGGIGALARSFSGAALSDVPPQEPQRQVSWWWGLLLLVLSLPELRTGWRTWVEARREARP